MPEIIDIINMREDLMKSLSASYSELWKLGKKLARAEHDYKIANRVEIFRLHEEDKTAWTACQTLAHGDDTVAQLRLNRDLAKVEYEVSQEKIQGLKLQLRLIESEIERDWSQSKRS
jgi:hypothetical protein